MDISVYQAAAAMNAGSRWQEIIAENLSASQIPGFKKQDLSFSAVQAGQTASTVKNLNGMSRRFVMPAAGATTNFRPGELRSTGVPTDFAIEGSGFFEVKTPDGKLGYTRDGEFHLNAEGQLVTKQGYLVMGEAGPIQFDPANGGAITVAATGEISQGGEVKGKLKIAEFNDPSTLTQAGNGLFLATSPADQPRVVLNPQIRQGVLESGNTSSVLEMSNLISAMRFYEANQKVIQGEDERLGRLISEVASST